MLVTLFITMGELEAGDNNGFAEFVEFSRRRAPDLQRFSRVILPRNQLDNQGNLAGIEAGGNLRGLKFTLGAIRPDRPDFQNLAGLYPGLLRRYTCILTIKPFGICLT